MTVSFVVFRFRIFLFTITAMEKVVWFFLTENQFIFFLKFLRNLWTIKHEMVKCLLEILATLFFIYTILINQLAIDFRKSALNFWRNLYSHLQIFVSSSLWGKRWGLKYKRLYIIQYRVSSPQTRNFLMKRFLLMFV